MSYRERANQYADLINNMNSGNVINDVDYFIFKMRIYNLLTPEIESFIEDSMKYFNEKSIKME